MSGSFNTVKERPRDDAIKKKRRRRAPHIDGFERFAPLGFYLLREAPLNGLYKNRHVVTRCNRLLKQAGPKSLVPKLRPNRQAAHPPGAGFCVALDGRLDSLKALPLL